MRQTLQMGYHHNESLLIYSLGALGTIVEWYDFAIYGHLAPVFAKLFFVGKSTWLSLVFVYSIFFVSYLARPLGGAIYGYIGDFFGRRVALLLSITMMSISMLVMALLPTWKTIGVFAPLFLLIFRIIQGISAGGETAGAIVYVLESVDHKRYGLYGSAIWSMTGIGSLLGSAVVALLAGSLSQGEFFHWGWRVAYFIGVGFGMVVLILRTFMPESIEFATAAHSVEESGIRMSPLKEVFRHHKCTLLIAICLTALAGSGATFIFFYFPQSIHEYQHVALSSAWGLNTLMQLLMVFALILFGCLSDFIGRMRLVPLGALGFLLFTYPLIHLTVGGKWLAIIMAQVLFIIMRAMYDGSFPAIIVDLTSLKIRYTIVALGFNVGFALFGGAAPLIATLLVHETHHYSASAFYLMLAAMISLLALLALWNRKRQIDC